MAEYVTLIEAAELEGVKYKTMAQRLSRNPDKFDTMTEKLENGGKDAVLVAVASLSKKARNAWKERAKLKELSGTISPEGEAQPEPEAPWYVEADVDWYIENYREQWYNGWKDHAAKGTSYQLLRRMEAYYKELWRNQDGISTDQNKRL